MPEGASKHALGNQVISCFRRLPTNVANIRVEDVLLLEVELTVDAILEEKPLEELNSQGSAAASDELMEVA